MFSFKLSDTFLSQYKDKKPPFGFKDAAGNSVGEIVFLRTYAALKEDGTKERWWEVCERVINQTYSIQKDWCQRLYLPWNGRKAQRSAQEAYDLMFNLKWSPPGRGLAAMGRGLVLQGNSSPLQNCCVKSTKDMTKEDPGAPYAFVMEALMLGIGVGYDLKGADKNFTIHQPKGIEIYRIPDTREGWAESTRLLINSYLCAETPSPVFDYQDIRPEGTPIRTFGGTAAGSQPLIELHERIVNLFEGREGHNLTELDIMDLMNMIGVCVVSGNVRRSALLSLGPKDNKDFINAKDYEQFPYRADWGWMSNNSVEVNVGDDLSHIIEGIQRNGEPGVVWMDTTRNYGRLADAPDYKDWRVVGYNPCCFAGDVYVQTTEGPKRISTMTERPWYIIVDGIPHKATSSWISGTKDIYRATLSNGMYLDLTADHRVMTEQGWQEIGQIEVGTKIVLSDNSAVDHWIGKGTEKEGYLVGSVKGDGYITNRTAYITAWEKDEGYDSIKNACLEACSDISRRSDWAGWRDYGRGCSVMTVSKRMIGDYLDLDNKDKKIDHRVEETSSDFHRGFLRGWFDTDGHVEVSKDSRCSIRLSSIDHNGLLGVQRMLARLGIMSQVKLAKSVGISILPDGQGGTKVYNTQNIYRLIISGLSINDFAKKVGFSHEPKSRKLQEYLDSGATFYNKRTAVALESFEFLRRDSVYDITVTPEHKLDANGIIAHNSEQPLESGEMCTLADVYISNCENAEEFQRAIKFSYLYAKTVTLLPTHWEETNAIMRRNLRIGLSVSGTTDFSDKYGISALKNWMEEGYKAVEEWDQKYSEWLCVRESIRMTTSKPGGTTSLVAGTSAGCHWGPGGQFFKRGIVFAKSDPMVQLLRDANYDVVESVYNSNSVFVQFPVKSKASRSEKEVSIFEKANMAALIQRHWSDNGVSCTISFHPENEKEHVGTILSTYEGQFKAISFLPMDTHGYQQAPYEPMTEEEFEQYSMTLMPLDLDSIYMGGGLEAEGERGCSTTTCEIRSFMVDSEHEEQEA